MWIYDFAEFFFSIILDIQKDRPELIDTGIDVINYYGLSRSEIQGATARSQVAKVPKDVINWINCWNIGEEYVVHRSMRVVYLERQNVGDFFGIFVATLRLLWGFQNPNSFCNSTIWWMS